MLLFMNGFNSPIVTDVVPSDFNLANMPIHFSTSSLKGNI